MCCCGRVCLHVCARVLCASVFLFMCMYVRDRVPVNVEECVLLCACVAECVCCINVCVCVSV